MMFSLSFVVGSKSEEGVQIRKDTGVLRSWKKKFNEKYEILGSVFFLRGNM